MKRKKNKMKTFNLYVMLSVVLISFSLSHAAEIEYPVAAYQGEALEKVREWEKNWVGKKITTANVDEVKDFLPESLYNIMKDVDNWGESWFTVVAYNQIVPTPGNIEATKKYSGKSGLTDEGGLTGWVAGVPFPDTTDPVEMAHNFRSRNFADGYSSIEKGFIIDGRLKYDMDLEIANNLLFFSGRTDLSPIPEFEDNPKQIWRAFMLHQLAPPETRNMRIMEIHYKDRTKAYDSWFWMPSIRRIRRRSTTERQDAQGGADFCGFDNMGWDGPIQMNTYKYLGQKEALLVRHQDPSKLEHTPGFCLWDGTQRERINAHVLEVTSRDPNFLYSKMIWYLDPETWQILYSDRYDRRGNLWKVLDQHGYVANVKGIDINHFVSNQMIDVQRTHSTIAITEFEFLKELEPSMFSLQFLQKHGY